jgi:hypothetical protein
MTGELTQADADAMLVAEAAALSVVDPTVWDRYQTRWIADVNRRIDERFPVPGGGGAGSGGGVVPGVLDAETGGS